MLIPRIIPCLLLFENTFVKTTRFKSMRYIGDPINTINLFNQFEVDEIVLLDIGCRRKNYEPNFALLEEIASECWVPLTYGGGINSVEQAKKIMSLGIEKIIIDSLLYNNFNSVFEFIKIFGSSSIVVSINVKKSLFGKYKMYSIYGNKRNKFDLINYINALQEAGVGEILLNNIDREGMMDGYDLDLIRLVSKNTSIPIVACGGAKTIKDCVAAIDAGASAASAASIFLYQNEEKGILINFPERKKLEELFIRD